MEYTNFIVDVILLLPFVWAAIMGYKEGVWVQLGGMVGVILGIWLGYTFGDAVGEMLSLEGFTAYIVGFITTIIVTILIIAIVSRLMKGLFRISGLGLLDHIGGIALSLCKTFLILTLLVSLFDRLNKQYSWVGISKLNQSILYTPIFKASEVIFPLAMDIKDSLLSGEEKKDV